MVAVFWVIKLKTVTHNLTRELMSQFVLRSSGNQTFPSLCQFHHLSLRMTFNLLLDLLPKRFCSLGPRYDYP